MASSSSNVSSSMGSTHGWNHDVFLNFRGKDNRNNFTAHLYAALSSKGINAFIDKKLERGVEITDALLKVIEGSQIAIVIFSYNYASSTYCLDELVKIWECRALEGHVILPIFYKVDPTHVQEVTGTYGKAFAKHKVNYSNSWQKWRSALVEVSNLTGEPYRNSEDLDEATFIKLIVKLVLDKLDRPLLHVAVHGPIGLDSHIQCIERMLDVESNDVVRKVGIWGMGGIGKTTLAKAIYNKFAHKFEASCFVRDVRKRSSECDDIAKMQEAILLETIGYENPLMGNFERGTSLINERLKNKRIFTVFDDVDHMDQLNNLVGGLNWFGRGSRIIITTRDEHLLLIHDVKVNYKLKELCDSHALELFSWNAFKKSQPDEDFIGLSQSIAKHAQGLPLALNVLGSSLLHRDKLQWEDMLSTLKRYPYKEITNLLKISYDALDNELYKKIFLDIACFFKGWDRDVIMGILSEYMPSIVVQILIERSLIYLDEKNRIQMHDLLQTMGRDIARCPANGAGGRRLCFKEDILPILLGNEGMHHDIEGIMLDLSTKEETKIDEEIFSKLIHLKVLIIRNAKFVSKGPKQFSFNKFFKALDSLPEQLGQHVRQLLQAITSKILVGRAKQFSRTITSKMKFHNMILMDFNNCEFLYNSPNFSVIPNLKRLRFSNCSNLEDIDESITCLENLQELNCDNCSSLQYFPNFSESTLDKNLKDLKRMSFNRCESLREIPDLSAIPNLQKLHLLGCRSLKKIDKSIGFLEKLNYFDIRFCHSLRSCPSLVRMKSLQHFRLKSCTKLERFPPIIETITDVTTFSLDNTAMEEIPSTIEYLAHLQYLCVRSCDKLIKISNRIYKLQHLVELRIEDCPKLEKFPTHEEEEEGSSTHPSNGLFPKLKELTVSNCNLEEYDFLNKFKMLRDLDLSGNNLANVDFLVKTLEYLPMLKSLDLSRNNFVCIPKSISKFTSLYRLQVNGCKQLVEILELPSDLLNLDLEDCESLEIYSQLTCIYRYQQCHYFNCLKLAENVGNNWMTEVIQNISSTPTFEYFNFCIVLPQDKIPEWFIYSTEGHSLLSLEMPSVHTNNVNIGIAFCFIFESQIVDTYEPIMIDVDIIIEGHPVKADRTFTLPKKLKTDHMFAFVDSLDDLHSQRVCSLPKIEVSLDITSKSDGTKIKCKRWGAQLFYKMIGER